MSQTPVKYMIVTIMEINALFLIMLKINGACIVGDNGENSAVSFKSLLPFTKAILCQLFHS